ncbi:hypothetical protein NE237_024586 [Protea cynaroides]|uniref:GAGA-binding transcriptional activator n=1 Tax=Protea cynaroides TaxID=273540 RepID=A0A9Q0H3M2_9MAGN|nr:hypothetical protein NE237_024586 [Protea cynaroides]
MDEKGRFCIRNWDFSEQSVGVNVLKPVSGVQLPGGTAERQAAFLKMGTYANRNSMIPEANTEASSMDYAGHWVHQRNFLPSTKACPSPLQAIPLNAEPGIPIMPTNLGVPTDGPSHNGEAGTKSSKKRKQQPSSKKPNHVFSEALKPKQPKKKKSVPTKRKANPVSTAIPEKKSVDVVIGGAATDFSRLPAPVCSCTGILRQCYRWGAGGWQSSCCTTSISEHPLPMSSSRPGARMAGRKMSNGAYAKLLQKLAAEGHDLSHPVDLKTHWAKHARDFSTEQFVKIVCSLNQGPVRDLGSVNYFLGVEVRQQSAGVYLTLTKCLRYILEQVKMSNAKSNATPVVSGKTLPKSDGDSVDAFTLYRNYVWAFLYFGITRGELTYAVNKPTEFDVGTLASTIDLQPEPKDGVPEPSEFLGVDILEKKDLKEELDSEYLISLVGFLYFSLSSSSSSSSTSRDSSDWFMGGLN